MKNRYIIPFLTILFLAITGHGCNTAKKIAGQGQQGKMNQAISRINSATHSLDARYAIQTGSMRLKGQVKIKEDSCLWLSAQFLGMEAGRALLTDNSIQVIYRLQKLCFRHDGWEYLPLARKCLNAVFLHKIILPDSDRPVITDFITAKTDNGGWQLIRHEPEADLSYFLDEQLQLTESRFTISGHSVKVSYSSFQEEFPSHITIAAPDFNLSLELDLSKITRNDIQDIEFNVPEGYSQAPINQLLRMFNI